MERFATYSVLSARAYDQIYRKSLPMPCKNLGSALKTAYMLCVQTHFTFFCILFVLLVFYLFKF